MVYRNDVVGVKHSTRRGTSCGNVIKIRKSNVGAEQATNVVKISRCGGRNALNHCTLTE